MGLNWNSLKWVQGEMRKQSLRGHHCCSSMVLVMAHGALRYVTCLATVYLYVPSLQACMFSLNKSKHYRVCMCAYEVKASFCIPACILCMQGSIGHLPFGPSSPTLYLSCATFYFYANYCFHAKLAACKHKFHTAVLQCRRTFCHGLPNMVIIALLSASEATAPAATSLLVLTPMLNPMMTWRMSLPLCLGPLCSLHTPWAASSGKGGLLYMHSIHTDQSWLAAHTHYSHRSKVGCCTCKYFIQIKACLLLRSQISTIQT